VARVNAKNADRAKIRDTVSRLDVRSAGQLAQSCVFTREIYVGTLSIPIRVYPRCINVEVADEENVVAD